MENCHLSVKNCHQGNTYVVHQKRSILTPWIDGKFSKKHSFSIHSFQRVIARLFHEKSCHTAKKAKYFSKLFEARGKKRQKKKNVKMFMFLFMWVVKIERCAARLMHQGKHEEKKNSAKGWVLLLLKIMQILSFSKDLFWHDGFQANCSITRTYSRNNGT